MSKRNPSAVRGGPSAPRSEKHLERPLADGVEVADDRRGTQDRKVRPAGPWRLEGVVEGVELRVERLVAAQAARDPELLVGRDVAEVPYRRAHDGVRPHRQRGVVERLDQQQRPRAHGVHAVGDPERDGRRRWVEGGHGRRVAAGRRRAR
jgi:hypothetical protein